MTLHLHRATRTDLLADGLGALLAEGQADPFAEELVVVPARGVERWLAQRLSHHLGAAEGRSDGVCAGVQFCSPASLVSLLTDRERDDPWSPDRLVWPVLATIDDTLDEPWCADLARHLGHADDSPGGEVRRQRRWSVARRLASLFAAYATARPRLVADWRHGVRVGDADSDGHGGQLPDDLAWQPELWRRVLARMAQQNPDVAPPDERHARALTALEQGESPGSATLPARLSLFGHTRLPVTEIELLDALARHRDVHLWLPDPSPVLWQRLAPEPSVVERAADTSGLTVRHPLLASLGRDTRELRRALSGVEMHDEPIAARPAQRDTLLGLLQADLRADALPSIEQRSARPFDPRDRSLQVHACHGPARQVEVLREVLVGLLDDDPTLEPRDILVMCPDIETYAPLVEAGFGLGEMSGEGIVGAVERGHPAHRLRVRLADRALDSTNPLLGVATTLVELAGGRVTASEVLDLLAEQPVRARFGFTDDDLDRIARWVGQSGVRWGLDAPSRQRYDMARFEHNTWRSGLDRILLGVALSGEEHRHLGRGLPVDDVGSSDIELAGRLAEAIERLTRCLRALAQVRDPAQCMQALTRGVRDLCLVGAGGSGGIGGSDDAWQLPQLERELARVAADAGASSTSLALADVRAVLRQRLAARPTRASFRTGSLTVCTMTPMRSVPHRVVCLLGLDDTVFPRQQSIDGDDVLARRPLTGERDPRSEDRQLLLDAVLAATETLVITYSGANESTGAERPPAVPLGEILDAADRTTTEPVRPHVLTWHPLQPHDVRNLEPGGLVPADPRPFSFDVAALDGALAAEHTVAPSPLLPGPLAAPVGSEEVSVADLRAFLIHPARTFLRERLRVTSPLEAQDVDDAIPVQLTGLDKWEVGDRLLRLFLAGESPSDAMHAELLRGTLPPFELGEASLREVITDCQGIVNATTSLREGRSAGSRDIDVDLGEGRRLVGTVGSVYGHRVISAGYSALKAKQRLSIWVDLLALAAAFPDEHWTGHAIGKGSGRGGHADGYVQGPLDDRALGWLRDLVALRTEGLTRPVPLPVETSAARAAQLLDRRGARNPRDTWEGSDSSPVPGERDDPWNARAFGSATTLTQLCESGLDERCTRIWEPLLGQERRVRL
ncbi:exodeoxyribonuclease V subunit gamma [Nocardioides acrostichi]|uniref:RecBCD enzyme subunit RecC n=1 Tax=Nocardioides acrostichi TaxID=2784339 RepID=A0A930UZ01_9ACTN|nr:exodeoxyribonuclease V subunit gamma [Nocardioides acrostichi]MBF4163483.1 exodeoxyribonuclease V subunit gamma [Nocardioides acrostichi]